METKVSTLKPASMQPVQGVIDILESALAKAKAGELRSVALYADVSGDLFWGAYDLENKVKTLGALSVIQANIFASLGTCRGCDGGEL